MQLPRAIRDGGFADERADRLELMSVPGAHDKIGNALLKQNDLEGALKRIGRA